MKQNGFRDGVRSYETQKEPRGVWISDRSVTECVFESEPCRLEIALSLDLFADYEWAQEGRRYREWPVPAHLINRHGLVWEIRRDETS